MGGGGKNPLRFILMLAVVAASFIVPAMLPATLAAQTIFGTLTVSQAVGAAIFGLGSLLVNAFIPSPAPKMKELNGTSGRDSPSLAIQGIRNTANPYGVVPRLYGKMRITPYFGAKTFTEIRGKDTILRALFDLGTGPLKLSEHRIGQTDLDAYEDVQFEVREGWPDDPPLTLYTRIPNEEGFNIRLLQNEWQQRTTEPDTDEISLDFTFPTGLAAFDTSGDKQPLTVEFDIEFRTTDTGGGPGAWQSATQPVAFGARLTATLTRPQPTQDVGFKNDNTNPKINHTVRVYRVSIDHVTGKIALVSGSSSVANPSKNRPVCAVAVSSNTAVAFQLTDQRLDEDVGAGYFAPTLVGAKVQIGAGTLTPPGFIVTDNSTATVRRNKAFKVDRGQYDVRVKRITFDSTADTVFHQSFWTALRTFTNEDPIAVKGHALVALEIRATDQLNGIVDQYNCIAESILWDYDLDLGDWIERPTSNPAAAYRHVLMGPENPAPLEGDRLYWPEIEAWSEECRIAGREFNAYIDFRPSVYEMLRLVAGCARADIAQPDGKYSVVRDRLQTVWAQHITPRNSWGMRWRRDFSGLPHAWRFAFKNREKDWLLDERIVPLDGWTEQTASKFTDLEQIGVTDPEQIFLEGRYREADLKLRATRYWLSMDFEHLKARHGSLVGLTHDVILVGIRSGRIKSLTLDVGNNVLGFTSDEVLPMEPGKTYAVSIRTTVDCKVHLPLQLSVGENTAVTFADPITPEDAVALGLADADDERPLFGFGETGLVTIECLVKRIIAGADYSARLELQPYNPAVLSADADPIPPFESKITLPSQFNFRAPEKPIVEDVKSDETVLAIQPDGSLESRIHIVLARKATVLPPAVTIKVRFKRHDAQTGAWQNMPAFPGDATEVWAQPVDDKVAYDVELQAVAADGSPSDWTRIENHTVIGQSTPPPDILTLLVETTSDGRKRARWAYPNQPRDHRGFVPRRLPGISFDFEQAQDLSDDPIPGTFVDLPMLDGVWTILVKAIDRAGNVSVNAATAIINLGEAEDFNILFERDYAAEGFDLGGDGTVVNGSLSGGELVADDSGDAFWTSDAAPFWTNDNAAFWSTTYEAMSYLAKLVPNTGYLPARLRLKLEVDAASWTIAYRPTGSQAPMWSADESEPMWTADSDPMWDPDPDFVPWPGELADLLHQEYEFRVNTSSGVKQGTISGFIAVLDTEDVTELLTNIAISAGGTRLPITPGRFRQVFHVQATTLSGGNAVNIVPIDYDHVAGPLVKGIDGNTPPNFVAATFSGIVHGI